MLVLLLPISFILLFLTINYYYNNIFTQKREQFVVAAVMCGFLVTFSIELLNVFKCITLVGLSCFWVLIDIVLVYILINKKGSFRLDTPVKFTGVQKFQLSGIIFILACVALIAFIAPPNNWDSLTYHMSRVAHWSQNKAVDFYPTQVYRQNEYAPWAEYVITQVYILQDSDRLVNFVQWFSLFLCTIGVSSIAKLLGQRREVQLMAAFFCVTIPMAILQGSSTQNDLVVSFWLVSATIFLLRWVKYHKNIDCVLFGLTIAHACLTKGSGVLFGSVLIASFILITIRRSFKTMGVKVVMIVSIIIVINAPFNMRLYHQSQTIFSKGDRAKSINEIYSPQALLSNITRNAGLHMTSSFKGLNELMESSIVRLHKVLDLDILDKRLSYGGSEYKIAESMHEDTAGNVLHFWMIFFCFIILIFIRSKDAILIKKYVLIPVLMGFVFVLLLRWNPFHSRYHLPIFILLAPLMAYVVTRWHHIFTLVMSMLCFGLVMPAVFQNTSRRMLLNKSTIFSTPRIDQYFSNDPTRAKFYKEAIATLVQEKCFNVGVELGADGWEYPVWALLKNEGTEFRIEHILREDSTKFPNGAFEPCAILSLATPQKMFSYNDGIYYYYRNFSRMVYYKKAPVSVEEFKKLQATK